MRLFRCSNCSHLIFFENTSCIRCGEGLVFDPHTCVMRTHPLANQSNRCRGGAPDCNWLAMSGEGGRCQSCALTINHSAEDLPQIRQWSQLESSKRRLLYTLLRLNLPLTDLRFSFPATGMTGHDHGLITIVLSEADDAQRERRRIDLHEPLRTLIGHFRHESGHFFFDRLGFSSEVLAEIRGVFGDEQANYGEALKAYYAAGPSSNWQSNFISAYATAHPCEDWAETWAHYLHMVDAVELSTAYGLQLAPTTIGAEGRTQSANEIATSATPVDAVGDTDFSALLESWLPLTYFGNSLNRSIGLHDWYPFVMSPIVLDKLALIHRLVGTWRSSVASSLSPVHV